MQQIGIIIFRDENWNMVNLNTVLSMKIPRTIQYITSLLMAGRLLVGRKTFEEFPPELQNSPLYNFNILSRMQSLSTPIEYPGIDKEGNTVPKTKEHVRMKKGSATIPMFDGITAAILELTNPAPIDPETGKRTESGKDTSPIYIIGGPTTYKESSDLGAFTFVIDIEIDTVLEGSKFHKIEITKWEKDKEVFEKDEHNEYLVKVKRWHKFAKQKVA